MSTNGETADMVVRESIQITESAVKLAGLGAKNLAALLMAVAKDNPKLSGIKNKTAYVHRQEARRGSPSVGFQNTQDRREHQCL